jgi:hypothetical protein
LVEATFLQNVNLADGYHQRAGFVNYKVKVVRTFLSQLSRNFEL